MQTMRVSRALRRLPCAGVCVYRRRAGERPVLPLRTEGARWVSYGELKPCKLFFVVTVICRHHSASEAAPVLDAVEERWAGGCSSVPIMLAANRITAVNSTNAEYGCSFQAKFQ